MQTENLNGRDRILYEAARLFVNKGYNGVSMREIGEASGMTKAALYYHFKDKQDLLREIIKASLEKTQAQFSKFPDTTLSTREQISQMINQVFHQEAGERGILHLIYVEASHMEEALHNEITAIYHDQFLNVLEKILQNGVQRSELKIIDSRLAARLLFGMMVPFIHPRQTRTKEEHQHTEQTILSIFFDGVTNRGCI